MYGGQLDEQLEKLDIVLSDKQKKLAGILTKSEFTSKLTKSNLNRTSTILGKNFSK